MGRPDPVRVIIDQNLRVSKDSAIYNGKSKTIILFGKDQTPAEEFLGRKDLRFTKINFEKEITSQICKVLFEENIQSVIIEGGSKTLHTFIETDSWDEARIFTGRAEFKNGIPAPTLKGRLLQDTNIASDNLKIYRND